VRRFAVLGLIVLVLALQFLNPRSARASAVIATIPVGNGVASVTVNPTTNVIYVANATDNTVSVIDGATNTVTSTIPVGVYPHDIVANPVTNKIYVL
jgi:YVTN family beta-propeller protein